jgi:hypothetical protein
MAVGGPDRMELICSDDYRNVKTMEIGRRLSLCRFSEPCEITWWQTDDGERWNCGGVGEGGRGGTLLLNCLLKFAKIYRQGLRIEVSGLAIHPIRI